MSDIEGLPVHGYQTQTPKRVELVNSNKQNEERILRLLDKMQSKTTANDFDLRWVAIARTHFEQGFMALNRSIFRPGRVVLPEDDAAGSAGEGS